MPQQKRKTKRSEVKFPGLQKGRHAKTKQDLIDHDYIPSLNDEQKAWLSRFNEEWIGGTFEKNKDGTYNDKVNLHKGVEAKRERWNANNARNRCILTIKQATGYVDKQDVYSEAMDNQVLKSPHLTELAMNSTAMDEDGNEDVS